MGKPVSLTYTNASAADRSRAEAIFNQAAEDACGSSATKIFVDISTPNVSPEWDDYFHRIAEAVAQKSKDSTKVGAVIVNNDEERLIISTGFNGLPRGIPSAVEQKLIHEAMQNDHAAKKQKGLWLVHAEANALHNAARLGACTKDATIYVNKFPCYACLQSIIQAGLRRIYTLDDEFWKHDPNDSKHQGKEYLWRAGLITIDAPNHRSHGVHSLPHLHPSNESVASTG